MSQIFSLPDVGEGLTEAEILSWKVAVGTEVAINDVLVEIETAKSVVELPSPYAGTVEELMVAEGETVEVGTPIIRISGGDGAAPAAPAAPQQETESGTALVGSDPRRTPLSAAHVSVPPPRPSPHLPPPHHPRRRQSRHRWRTPPPTR